MKTPDQQIASTSQIDGGRTRAFWLASVSIARSIPLLLSRRPRTPLRVLCIAAFDTIRCVKYRKKLSSHQTSSIAALLDLGALANDLWDDSRLQVTEFRHAFEELENLGCRELVDEYLAKLQVAEANRPLCDGDHYNHVRVRSYRESVVTTSLEAVSAVAFGNDRKVFPQSQFRTSKEFQIVFRLVMVCQIIDDTVDATLDRQRNLPGFLTSTSDSASNLATATKAAQDYASLPAELTAPHLFPFRLMIRTVSWLARALLLCRSWLTAIGFLKTLNVGSIPTHAE